MKQAYIEMGKVLQAYEQRSQVRSKAKAMMKQYDSAYSNVRMFGMYDDCGPSYIQEYDNIRSVLGELVEQKKSLDKCCKKLRCEFIETYPDYASELLEEITKR